MLSLSSQTICCPPERLERVYSSFTFLGGWGGGREIVWLDRLYRPIAAGTLLLLPNKVKLLLLGNNLFKINANTVTDDAH